MRGLGGPEGASLEGFGDMHAEVESEGFEGGESFLREFEEAPAGGDPAGVGGVAGEEEVFLEVNEGAGDLNEALEEGAIGVKAAQPEVFEDVMGLVELTVVEAFHEGVEFAGKRGGGQVIPAGEQALERVAFFHSRAGKIFLALKPVESPALGE